MAVGVMRTRMGRHTHILSEETEPAQCNHVSNEVVGQGLDKE